MIGDVRSSLFLVFAFCRIRPLYLLSSPYLLNVVHTYEHPIPPLIEDSEFFSQFLLVIHGSGQTKPSPPFEPWPPGSVRRFNLEKQVHPEPHPVT